MLKYEKAFLEKAIIWMEAYTLQHWKVYMGLDIPDVQVAGAHMHTHTIREAGIWP